MAKIVCIECLVEQTLVKDETGKKVKVKKGDVFKTDSNTAEIYLTAYKRSFRLVSDEENAGNPQRQLELENRIQELEVDVSERDEKISKLEQEVKDVKLEALREKHQWVPLSEIPYNDLVKIARLKWVEFSKNPKTDELIKMITEADASEVQKDESDELENWNKIIRN